MCIKTARIVDVGTIVGYKIMARVGKRGSRSEYKPIFRKALGADQRTFKVGQEYYAVIPTLTEYESATYGFSANTDLKQIKRLLFEIQNSAYWAVEYDFRPNLEILIVELGGRIMREAGDCPSFGHTHIEGNKMLIVGKVPNYILNRKIKCKRKEKGH